MLICEIDSNTGYQSLREILKWTTLLSNLDLNFLDLDYEWGGTDVILAGLAKEEDPLTDFQELSITGMQCDGGDLEQFLRNQKKFLANLDFNNMIIKGPQLSRGGNAGKKSMNITSEDRNDSIEAISSEYNQQLRINLRIL